MHPKKATVLVVDDDVGHLSVLKTVIRSWGYEVEGADDGSKAVEKAKERPFDLIVTDVRMAEMSGIEALKVIKQYNPAIPILIMTAYSSVESAVEALKAGAYDYLTCENILRKSFHSIKFYFIKHLFTCLNKLSNFNINIQLFI